MDLDTVIKLVGAIVTGGALLVTLGRVLERLRAVEGRQGTCVSKESLDLQLSAASERWADSAQQLSERTIDHEKRLRRLEASRTWPPDRPPES